MTDPIHHRAQVLAMATALLRVAPPAPNRDITATETARRLLARLEHMGWQLEYVGVDRAGRTDAELAE